MSKFEDHYAKLEIEKGPHATMKEIKKAYLKMSRKLHPDKNRNDPNADDKFAKMFMAYEIISDPKKRPEYDRKYRAKKEAEIARKMKDANRKKQYDALEKREQESQLATSRAKAATVATKLKIQEEIERLRREMELEARRKAEEQRDKELHKSAVSATWGSSDNYSEQNVRDIFHQYGRIIAVRMRKRGALIVFQIPEQAVSVCEDEELGQDFGITVKFLGEKKAVKRRKLGLEWKTIRPAGMAFSEYEAWTLQRLRKWTGKGVV